MSLIGELIAAEARCDWEEARILRGMINREDAIDRDREQEKWEEEEEEEGE